MEYKFDYPSIPVTARTGRIYERDFNFTGNDGKPVHLSRRAISGIFDDCFGQPVNCQFLPVRDWEFDLKPLSCGSVLFAVCGMELDKNGVCICRFCGYEVQQSASELKRKQS